MQGVGAPAIAPYKSDMAILYILIAIGMGATLVVLLAGVFVMGGDGKQARRRSNKLMQMRVAAQFLTLLLIGLAFLIGAGM